MLLCIDCLHLLASVLFRVCYWGRVELPLVSLNCSHFTDIFALGLWLLESAKESGRLPQTSLAFLDFSATGEWHPARPVAVVGASALHPEVAWSSYCCWSAVGGRVAAGGLVAVVVPVCGVGGCAVLLVASANSQPCEKLRAKKRFRVRCFSRERAFYNH